MKFTNLLGIECITESHQTIEYDIKLLSLFEDSISSSIMEKPIIQLNYPQNIYDLKVLFNWYSRSNVEPLIVPKLKFKIPINLP